MAEQVAVPPSLASQAAEWLKLLGGVNRTESTTSDTSGLQGTMAGLQGQDYEAMLQAIFQKAGGQIPGIQQALGNAMGARSGGNSAVAAALQKLLAQTSTGAMNDIAKLQAQNLATQANVGSSMAQATRQTKTNEGVNTGGGLEQAAKLIAILQGAKTLGLDKAFTTGDKTSGATGAHPDRATTGYEAMPATGLFDQISNFFQPAATTSQEFTPTPTDMTGVYSDPYTDVTPSFEPATPYVDTVAQPELWTPAPMETYQTTAEDLVDYGQYYVDGGLVKKPEGYADGGTVRSSGSRRSANPTVDLAQVMREAAMQGDSSLKGSAGNVATAPVASPMAAPMIPMPGGSSGGGVQPTTSTNTAGQLSSRDFQTAISKALAASTVSGLTGGPALDRGAGGVLGLAGGLAGAKTPGQAMEKVGKFALDKAAPGAGSLISFAQKPSVESATNLAASLNPLGALWTGVSTLTGLPAPGTLVSSLVDSMGLSQTDTAQNTTAETEAAALAPTLDMPVSGRGSNGSGYGGWSSDRGGEVSGTPSSSSGVSNGSMNAADGGPIQGPGTGTSDSIPARLSAGEFVMSADVVEALGSDFFEQLQAAFHTPVAVQSMQAQSA